MEKICLPQGSPFSRVTIRSYFYTQIKKKKIILPQLYFRQYYNEKKDLQEFVCELKIRIGIRVIQKDRILLDPQHFLLSSNHVCS